MWNAGGLAVLIKLIAYAPVNSKLQHPSPSPPFLGNSRLPGPNSRSNTLPLSGTRHFFKQNFSPSSKHYNYIQCSIIYCFAIVTISLLHVSVIAIVRESSRKITSNTILSLIEPWTVVVSTAHIYYEERKHHT